MSNLRVIVLTLAIAVGVAARAETPSLSPTDDKSRLILSGLADPIGAMLLIDGHEEGVALSIEPGFDGDSYLVSRWPFLPQVNYLVAIDTHGRTVTLPFALSEADEPEPGVRAIAPNEAVVPENLLRFHLYFNTAMARGQAREYVSLSFADGTPIPGAFLELGIELWSPDQRRLTMLFDPGRIKQGVGPNLALGSPLSQNERFVLEVRPGMLTAAGNRTRTGYRHEFRAGAPQSGVININEWTVTIDEGDLTIDFGREMDAESVARYVVVVAADGRQIRMRSSETNPIWDVSGFGESMPLRVVANPLLEDAAGNTLCAPFDVPANASTRCKPASDYSIELAR